MRDSHIRRAAADINRGHAQRTPRLDARLRRAIRTGEGGEKGLGLAAEMGNGFVIQPHQLAAAGLVPLHLDLRNRHHAFFLLLAAGKVFILRVPAHRFPDDGDGFEHAATENLALLFRHRRRQGEDQRPQLAGRGREAEPQAGGHAVNLAKRLSQQLAEHVRHQGAAAVLRREYRQAFILRQRKERFPVVVHQVHQRKRGCQRFALSFAVHLAKAPVLHHRRLVPQIATRAGDTAVAFRAQTLHRQLTRFITHADNRRPDECILPAAFHREVLLAKTRFGKFKTAGKQRFIQELRLTQRSYLKFSRLAQAVVGITMIFNNHAAGMGVAYVKDQIDRNGRGAQGMGDKLYFRHGELFTEHGEQVEPVRLIFKAAHGLMQLALGAFFNPVSKLREGFAQPAVNPGLVEETFNLTVAPGERETRAVQDIVFNRRQGRRRMLCNLAVERDGDPVRIASRVGGGKLSYLDARPVIRAFNKRPRRVKAQERERQPDAVQHSQGVMQWNGAFRLDHFRLPAIGGRQRVPAVNQVKIQAQQRAICRFTHETPVAGGVLRSQAKIEKLHAAVSNQRHALFIVAKINQHRIRHLLS